MTKRFDIVYSDDVEFPIHVTPEEITKALAFSRASSRCEIHTWRGKMNLEVWWDVPQS